MGPFILKAHGSFRTDDSWVLLYSFRTPLTPFHSGICTFRFKFLVFYDFSKMFWENFKPKIILCWNFESTTWRNCMQCYLWVSACARTLQPALPARTHNITSIEDRDWDKQLKYLRRHLQRDWLRRHRNVQWRVGSVLRIRMKCKQVPHLMTR